LAQHGTSYFGRYEAVAKLSNLLDGDDPVVWIFGASGAGKSALLAQALAQMPRFQGQRLAIATFPDDADLGLLQEALATTWSALYPSDHHDCAGAMDIREFRARLDKAAAAAVVNNETIALVWDNAPSHRWTDHPADLFNLPTNVRLVVTSRDPPPKAKGLAAFHVPMPTINEISEFLTGRLSSLGRRFPDPVLRELLQATGIRDYRHRSRPASHCQSDAATGDRPLRFRRAHVRHSVPSRCRDCPNTKRPRNRWFARLPAGGRRIRTCSTAARKPGISGASAASRVFLTPGEGDANKVPPIPIEMLPAEWRTRLPSPSGRLWPHLWRFLCSANGRRLSLQPRRPRK